MGRVKQFEFKDFQLVYPEQLEPEVFEWSDIRGIIFEIDRLKYQVLDNMHMGYRILIYGEDGSNRDIPFHRETDYLLPDMIQIEWKDASQ